MRSAGSRSRVAAIVVMAVALAACAGARANVAVPARQAAATTTTASTTTATTSTSMTTGPTSTTTTTTTTPTPTPTTSVATSGTSSTIAAVPPATSVEAAPAPAEPFTMVVIGDSTASALADGLVALSAERDDLRVIVETIDGCGLLSTGEYFDGVTLTWRRPPSGCVDRIERAIPARVAAVGPDVVVAMVTSWDVAERRWPDGVETVPASAEHSERLRDEYGALTATLLGAGARRVAWVLPPTPNGFWVTRGQRQESEAWQRASRDVYVELAEGDERIDAVDLAGWMRVFGLDRDVAVRPDGIHLAPGAARWIGTYLVAELTASARWSSRT